MEANMNVSLCFQRLRKLKDRLITINTVVKGNSLEQEIEALNKIIIDMGRMQFTNIMLVIGHPESFADIELPTVGIQDDSGTILAMCSINPSKFEISLIRKYFLLQDSKGWSFTEKDIYDIPFSWLCDRYYPTCDKQYKHRKAIYMEGLVSNENITEYGHKGIKEGLLSWLHKFYTVTPMGEPQNQETGKENSDE
jgi:hypothetical protein